MATLRPSIRFRFKPIRAKLFADLLECRELPRTQFNDHRHQEALPSKLALAPRPQMLLEQYALVGDVLVDDPQAFAVHRHDEAAVHLAKGFRLAISSALGSEPGADVATAVAVETSSSPTVRACSAAGRGKFIAPTESNPKRCAVGGPARPTIRTSRWPSTIVALDPNTVGITARGGPGATPGISAGLWIPAATAAAAMEFEFAGCWN